MKMQSPKIFQSRRSFCASPNCRPQLRLGLYISGLSTKRLTSTPNDSFRCLFFQVGQVSSDILSSLTLTIFGSEAINVFSGHALRSFAQEYFEVMAMILRRYNPLWQFMGEKWR
jgi:hypothetical protein